MCTEIWLQEIACEILSVHSTHCQLRIACILSNVYTLTLLCRLDHSGCVKVGDFGLAEDIYSTGYVREDNKTVKVPYKWMPPESLEDALFSELSDVVRNENCIVGNSYIHTLTYAVVVWSDVLGDLHSW